MRVAEYNDKITTVRIDQQYLQWKYQALIKQCQGENAINTEQLRDILLEIQQDINAQNITE
jgi:hypothetical protein